MGTDEIADFLSFLPAFEGLPSNEDQLIWTGHSKGNYTVKTCYNLLISNSNQLEFGPWKQLCDSKAPMKVLCLVRLGVRNACLTQENLRRGFHIVSRCFMCEEEAETGNHLIPTLCCHLTTMTDLFEFFGY